MTAPFSPRTRSILILALACAVITVWTVLRLGSRIPVYDLVGQQDLAAQWLAGQTAGSVTAPTHYLLKTLLIYVPFHLMALPPFVGLVAMTVVINCVTLVLVWLAIRSVARSLRLGDGRPTALAVLLLAVLAGSVFWVGFANSRNLEVAAGLLSVALALRVADRPTRARLAALTVVASLAFFMDPLQIYMSGLPVALFLCIRAVRRRYYAPAAWTVGALSAGVAVGYGLTLAAQAALHVTFFSVASVNTGGLLSNPIGAIRMIAGAHLRLFGGSYELGSAVRVLNVAAVAFIWVSFAVSAVRCRISRRGLAYVIVFAATIEIIYAASGQWASGETSRYLIMLAPLTLLVLVALMRTKLRYAVTAVTIVVIAVNGAVLLAVARPVLANPALQGEGYLSAAAAAADESPYGYASIDTALTARYFTGTDRLLPLGCGGRLERVSLFFDVAGYRVERTDDTPVPVILDGAVITNAPHGCPVRTVIGQLGTPLRRTVTSDGSTVLFYPARTLTATLGPVR